MYLSFGAGLEGSNERWRGLDGRFLGVVDLAGHVFVLDDLDDFSRLEEVIDFGRVNLTFLHSLEEGFDRAAVRRDHGDSGLLELFVDLVGGDADRVALFGRDVRELITEHALDRTRIVRVFLFLDQRGNFFGEAGGRGVQVGEGDDARALTEQPVHDREGGLEGARLGAGEEADVVDVDARGFEFGLQRRGLLFHGLQRFRIRFVGLVGDVADVEVQLVVFVELAEIQHDFLPQAFSTLVGWSLIKSVDS